MGSKASDGVGGESTTASTGPARGEGRKDKIRAGEREGGVKEGRGTEVGAREGEGGGGGRRREEGWRKGGGGGAKALNVDVESSSHVDDDKKIPVEDWSMAEAKRDVRETRDRRLRFASTVSACMRCFTGRVSVFARFWRSAGAVSVFWQIPGRTGGRVTLPPDIADNGVGLDWIV